MISKGDLVWIHHGAKDVVRNEEIAPRGIVIRKLPDSIWYRVYMSWSDKTKIADFPVQMLEKIVE